VAAQLVAPRAVLSSTEFVNYYRCSEQRATRDLKMVTMGRRVRCGPAHEGVSVTATPYKTFVGFVGRFSAV
jgi:hypothetical protein